MVQDDKVMFGVKRYHPVEGAKKFVVASYDELPGESEHWYDTPAKAAASKDNMQLVEELKTGNELMGKEVYDPVVPAEILLGVEQLLSGKTVNGKKGLSNISFTTLYGCHNNDDKKKLKPLFIKLIESYGDLIAKDRSVYFWRK